MGGYGNQIGSTGKFEINFWKNCSEDEGYYSFSIDWRSKPGTVIRPADCDDESLEAFIGEIGSWTSFLGKPAKPVGIKIGKKESWEILNLPPYILEIRFGVHEARWGSTKTTVEYILRIAGIIVEQMNAEDGGIASVHFQKLFNIIEHPGELTVEKPV